MKSKAHGSIQETMRATLNRLMSQAGYNPKTLSEAAELNRGYVTGILKGGRGIGPEVLIGLADPLSRVLGRDGRTIVLEILGYNTQDLFGGRETPLHNAIAEAVRAETMADDTPAELPPVTPPAPVVMTVQDLGPDIAELLTGNRTPAPVPSAGFGSLVLEPVAVTKTPKAPAKPKAAKPPTPAPEVIPVVAAPAVPLGFKVFTWADTLQGKAARFVICAQGVNAVIRASGMGKAKFYRIVTEASEGRDIAAAVAKPGELLAYDIEKPSQIKNMAAWV